MKNLFKLPSILVLAGLMTIQVSVVSASVRNTYHSSECSPLGTKIRGYQYTNALKNVTSGNITVVCPIIRKMSKQPVSGTFALDVIVNVKKVVGKSYTCTLSLYGDDGIFVASRRLYDNKSFMNLRFRNSEISDGYYASMGAYNLTCKLPPGGSLHTYTVEEWVDVD